MMVIDEAIGEFRYKIYKNKFSKFRVSPSIAMINIGDNSINMIKLVNDSSSATGLKDAVIVDLLGPRDEDFLIFSLLFGLYFDTFNLYSYMHINPDIRRDIAIEDFDASSTHKFFEDNERALFAYFSEEYGINIETYRRIVDSLFYVNDKNNPLYNSPIVHDIGKILFGKTLSKRFDGARQCIELFDNMNNIIREKRV